MENNGVLIVLISSLTIIKSMNKLVSLNCRFMYLLQEINQLGKTQIILSEKINNSKSLLFPLLVFLMEKNQSIRLVALKWFNKLIENQYMRLQTNDLRDQTNKNNDRNCLQNLLFYQVLKIYKRNFRNINITKKILLERQLTQSKLQMGGDAFEGVQKLTDQQYKQITQELLKRLTPLCQKIQPYIPLPEKQVHGDVDFLVILKENFEPKDIIEGLKSQKIIINSLKINKLTIFLQKTINNLFELATFYKSYSGIGAYLGAFLPSKQIKLTPQGLIALRFWKHLKLQFLISDQIGQILKFYGLDYERYKLGFKNRKQLFEFIRGVKFLNQQKFAYHEHKATTKLVKFFCDYLKNQGIKSEKIPTVYENALEQTLDYFKKNEQYKTAFNLLLDSKKRSQQLNKKFNATHILSYFDIQPKQVNQIKKKFNILKFENDQEKYLEFIEKNDVETILKEFEDKLNLKVKPQEI